MRKLVPSFLVGLLGLTAACNRADEGLQGVVTPGAANLFLEDITSERRTWTVGGECTATFPLPSGTRLTPGSALAMQVIRITARVEWLGTGKCEGGTTPRECQPGTLNAGDPCVPNTGTEGVSQDCDLNAVGDGQGVCGKRPCQFDSDCAVGDTCGSTASRLVFAAADTDARPDVSAEIGTVLFDNGNALVPFHTSGGNLTSTSVRTGDLTARDLTYTREFLVFFSSTAGSAEECVARVTGLTPVRYPKNLDLLFRIDAIDAISGAARLTSTFASTPVRSEVTCCKLKTSTSCVEICNNTEPICQQTTCT